MTAALQVVLTPDRVQVLDANTGAPLASGPMPPEFLRQLVAEGGTVAVRVDPTPYRCRRECDGRREHYCRECAALTCACKPCDCPPGDPR